jgi:hypothetical protein
MSVALKFCGRLSHLHLLPLVTLRILAVGVAVQMHKKNAREHGLRGV